MTGALDETATLRSRKCDHFAFCVAQPTVDKVMKRHFRSGKDVDSEEFGEGAG